MQLASLTSSRRTAIALRSTVALKAAMAVSGLVMMVYLIVHMYGNLKIFSGRTAFDGYAHHLRTIGEPFLPYAGALLRVAAAAVTRAERTHEAYSGRTPRSRCAGVGW